jgi:prevent-host-death family protein
MVRMIEANMLEAKTRLSELVGAAERGEEVIIKRRGVPVARIVPVVRKELPFGFLQGKVPPIEDSVMFGSLADLFEGKIDD